MGQYKKPTKTQYVSYETGHGAEVAFESKMGTFVNVHDADNTFEVKITKKAFKEFIKEAEVKPVLEPYS